jgi:hypothetical protein
MSYLPRKIENERQLADGRMGGGGEANAQEGENAWSSIYHSVLSGIIFACNITYVFI